MAPKPKLAQNQIIETAFEHVRMHGWQGLTARYLAEKLETSTKPIYFHFDSMQAIENAIVEKAMGLILDYTQTSRTGDPWIDQALGVILFAIEEKHLFRAIFDDKHVQVRRKYSAPVWSAGRKQLSNHPLFAPLSDDHVEMIRRARWVFTHGLASLMSISNWPWHSDNQPMIENMIRRISNAVYNEFKDDPEPLLNATPFQNSSEPDKK